MGSPNRAALATWIESIQKAVAHKYRRRWRVGNRWRYEYPPKKGDRHAAGQQVKPLAFKDGHIHEGAAFSAGAGKGHLVIAKVDGDVIHYFHDDADGEGTHGPTLEVSRAQFMQAAIDAHKDGIDAYIKAGMERRKALLDRAKEGTPERKRAGKEVKRWQSAHKDSLPKPTPEPKRPKGGLVGMLDRVNAKKKQAAATEPTTVDTLPVEVVQHHEEIKDAEIARLVEPTPAPVGDPPSIWDLSKSAISELRRKRIITSWEEGFLAGKRWQQLSDFSPKQRENLKRIQASFILAWPSLAGQHDDFIKESQKIEGAGDRSLAQPDLLALTASGLRDLNTLTDALDEWTYGFIRDNLGKQQGRMSEKQLLHLERATSAMKKAWRENLTIEQQREFLSTHAPTLLDDAGKKAVDAPPPPTAEQKKFVPPKAMQASFDKGLQLHPYQLEYLDWVETTPKGINAMDTGLGKTLSTIVAFHKMQDAGVLDGAVVIAPVSAMNSWRNELKKHSTARVGMLHGTPAKRKKVIEAWKRGEYDVLLSTYATATRDANELKPLVGERHMVVADEAHYLKNEQSARSKAIGQISHSAGRLVALTATPQPNRPEELFAVTALTAPGKLGRNKWDFAERYCHILRTKYGSEIGGYREAAQERLTKDLKPIMFIKRRNDPDVEKTLPARHHVITHVGMDDASKKIYNAEVKKAAAAAALASMEGGAFNHLTHALRLRQISVHPSLAGHDQTGESAKIEAVADAVVAHLQTQPDKGAVVFGEFNGGLKLARDAAIARGIQPEHIATITGETPQSQRKDIEDRLNSGELKVLFANTRAMETGANLQGNANFVGLIDTPWSPSTLTQAIDRVHRQGQKNPVTIFHPVSSPLEQHQHDVLSEKLKQSGIAMGGLGGGEAVLAEAIKDPKTPEEFVEFYNAMLIED